MFPQTRMRRFRKNETIRKMVRESRVHAEQLIYPIFVVEGEDQINPIDSMPGIISTLWIICWRKWSGQLLLAQQHYLFGIPQRKMLWQPGLC